jgi:hypothetical protein
MKHILTLIALLFIVTACTPPDEPDVSDQLNAMESPVVVVSKGWGVSSTYILLVRDGKGHIERLCYQTFEHTQIGDTLK